ncbi:hypothetical protein CRENBAI_026776 [Crenichthys baileyi]|uniref:Uncharacterized protein n=1 Tax=Crenichthys baileyi TaxID=28760 RepID=A0AAV9R2E9_9TELE
MAREDRAEEVEEQGTPFWGSRLAIPLPGTGPRRYTPSSSSQCKPLQPFCPPSDFELPVCSSSRRRHRRHQDTVFPVEIRTGASLSFPEGLANLPLAWCPRLHFLVPSLAPAITQCPLVALEEGIRLFLYSLERLYKLFPVHKVNLSFLHGSSPVWLLLGLLILKPVSRTLQCFELQLLFQSSADAPASVFAEDQLVAPVSISTEGQLDAPVLRPQACFL